MTDKKYWLTSGIFTMMHRGIDFLLGFIGFMLLVRILSPEEFGVWVLMITIVAIIDMARNGFLQNGMIKFLVGKNRYIQAKIQSAALILNSLLTLIFIGMIWIMAPWLERKLNADGLAEILKIYSFVLPVLVIHTHNLVLMQAKFDFKAYFFAGISKSFPFFAVVLYFYTWGSGLDLTTLAWYQNAAFFTATIVSVYQVKNHLIFRGSINKYWNKKIFHFGKFVFGTNLVSMLTNSLDKFLLGALLSPVQVALANTAGRVMNMVEIPVNSIASISYPKASEAHDGGKFIEVARIYEKTLGMMLSLTFPFWLLNIIFADYIIWFIAGDVYLEAVPFLRVMAILALIKPFDRQSGVFLDAIGRPFVNMIMVIGTFIYGAVLSWFLIKAFGLLGAAYGLVLAVLITAVIKQIILSRYIPFKYLNCFAEAWHNYPKIVTAVYSKISKA